MKLTIHPLTPDRWAALEDLFGKSGACNGCWCMYWRIGSAYRDRPREKNKADFRKIVKRGPPPGLLAFDGEVAVGWCQLAPRAALPHLERARALKRVDATPVWTISCFYVRRGYRRHGVATALIGAALKAAKRAKAPRSRPIPSIRRRRRAPQVSIQEGPRRSRAPGSGRSPGMSRIARSFVMTWPSRDANSSRTRPDDARLGAVACAE